jgi:hypothetical protein
VFQVWPPARRAICGRLPTPWTPHALRLWFLIQGFEEPIEIDDVRYGVFELIMLWLYSGGDAEMRVEENELIEVSPRAWGQVGFQVMGEGMGSGGGQVMGEGLGSGGDQVMGEGLGSGGVQVGAKPSNSNYVKSKFRTS